MMRTALIKDGAVVNVIMASGDFAAPDGMSVVTSDTANIGDVYDGAAFAPPAPPAPTKEQLVAYAASKRFAVETGGIAIGGVKIATDRESQSMVNGARAAAKDDASFTTDWKGSDGTWTHLDAPTIIAIADAMKTHVAACFSAEKTVDGEIASGAVTTRAQIDAAAWPANG